MAYAVWYRHMSVRQRSLGRTPTCRHAAGAGFGGEASETGLARLDSAYHSRGSEDSRMVYNVPQRYSWYTESNMPEPAQVSSLYSRSIPIMVFRRSASQITTVVSHDFPVPYYLQQQQRLYQDLLITLRVTIPYCTEPFFSIDIESTRTEMKVFSMYQVGHRVNLFVTSIAQSKQALVARTIS